MKNFSKIFHNELIKVNSSQTILKVAIAILILFVIVTVSFNFIIETIGDYMAGFENISPENLELQISVLKNQIKEMEDSPKTSMGIADNTLYQLKAKLAMFEYARDNNVSLSSKSLFGSMSVDSAGYVTTIMDLVQTILVVFSVVMVVKTFHSEKSNGTLKMQMIRPVNRKSMLFAKMLAIFTVSFVLYFVFTVLAEIVAIIKFGTSAKDVLYVLNASIVGEMNFASYLVLTFFVDLFEMFCYMQLAYFMCSIFWRKESIMGLTIVVVLLGPMLESILNYIYIGYVGFFNNLDFLLALNPVTGPNMQGANLYSMLAITIVYQVAMMAYSFIHFDKCDIA